MNVCFSFFVNWNCFSLFMVVCKIIYIISSAFSHYHMREIKCLERERDQVFRERERSGVYWKPKGAAAKEPAQYQVFIGKPMGAAAERAGTGL